MIHSGICLLPASLKRSAAVSSLFMDSDEQKGHLAGILPVFGSNLYLQLRHLYFMVLSPFLSNLIILRSIEIKPNTKFYINLVWEIV